VKLIQPVVSRHLKILKDCGILRYGKDGNRGPYSVTDQQIFRIIDGVTPELVETFTTRMLEQII